MPLPASQSEKTNHLKKFLKNFGPGFVTGASDDDPSGIATYTQVGAQFGFGQLWTGLIMFPLMFGVQEMVARIGVTTGQGIGAILRRRYAKWILYLFVLGILIANTFNIGADLGAMADAAKIIFPQLPFAWLIIFFATASLFLEIYLSYRVYVRILKWLALSLFCYLFTLIIVTDNWRQLLFSALVPHLTLSKEYLFALTAVLGTTISPYLFIWQADEEVEEEIADGKTNIKQRRGATDGELSALRRDTWIGMFFSQIITFCIIATAANTFFINGIFDIQTSAQAAQALRPLAGSWAAMIYAFGIIGTGLLAIPVLSASASYALSEAFCWHEGLYKKFHQARKFYSIIIFATILGTLLNFIGLNPIKALIWAAVLNCLVTPPLLLIILKIANDPKIMKKDKNPWWSNLLGWTTFIFATLCAISMFVL